jgi:hypothetical protein
MDEIEAFRMLGRPNRGVYPDAPSLASRAHHIRCDLSISPCRRRHVRMMEVAAITRRR